MRSLRRIVLISLAAFFLIWIFLPAGGPSVQDGSVLVVELSGSYAEASQSSFIGRLLGDRRRPFVSLLSELEKARRDERISAVVLRVRRLQMSWSMAQELRTAIDALEDAGRRTVAYLEVGGLGANREYYLASAAQELIASPGTQSPVLGLSMEFFFYGGLWEKLGAGFEAIGSGEYKSAAETIAGTKMSAAHREMATALLDSTFDQFVAGIAEGRGLDEARVRELVDWAPVTPEELLESELIDSVLGFEAALKSLGEGREVIYDSDYAAVPPSSVGFDPVGRFALVYGSGTVAMGKGTVSPAGGMVLTSDTVGDALEEAAEDPSIDAIVFRVDSPGGSPLASDIIWSAAQRARSAGKPLVASVSGVAASGGYYVLCGADEVVAPPGSLVGSIGVFAMRPVIGELLGKLGITHESMKRGDYADLLVFSRPLDDAGRARLIEEIDSLYDLFWARVADGRGMSSEAVDHVGRGRVWTGAQAHERGLVDELGGLRTALRRAKLLAGLEPDDDVELVIYPQPRSLAEQVADALDQVAARASASLVLPPALEQLESLVRMLPPGRPLLVAPFAVEIQ
jgi:protease-4